MIRTMWLALFCLAVVSTAAVVRFVTSASGSVVTIDQNASAPFEPAIVSNAQSETLTKSDKLLPPLALASPEETPVVPIELVSLSPGVSPSASPGISPSVDDTIVSRHWHESSVPVRLSNVASSRKVKTTNPKNKTVPARSTEAKCSQDSSRTLLESLNLSPKCRSASKLPVKRTATSK
jgi:hypothetical protein